MINLAIKDKYKLIAVKLNFKMNQNSTKSGKSTKSMQSTKPTKSANSANQTKQTDYVLKTTNTGNTNNMFAVLSSNNANVRTFENNTNGQTCEKNKDEPVTVVEQVPVTKPTVAKSDKRDFMHVHVTADIPVKELSFAELCSALCSSFKGFTGNTAFGNEMWESTPKLRNLIAQLTALFVEKSDDIADDILWCRCFHKQKTNSQSKGSFSIKGDDLPFISETKDNLCANIETILRLVCNQIRAIKEKKLVSRGVRGLQSATTEELQSDIDLLCTDFLGELKSISVGDRTFLSEPLVDELRNAFKNASDSKKKAVVAKEAKLVAARERANARPELNKQQKVGQKKPNLRLKGSAESTEPKSEPTSEPKSELKTEPNSELSDKSSDKSSEKSVGKNPWKTQNK